MYLHDPHITYRNYQEFISIVSTLKLRYWYKIINSWTDKRFRHYFLFLPYYLFLFSDHTVFSLITMYNAIFISGVSSYNLLYKLCKVFAMLKTNWYIYIYTHNVTITNMTWISIQIYYNYDRMSFVIFCLFAWHGSACIIVLFQGNAIGEGRLIISRRGWMSELICLRLVCLYL